MLLDDPDPKPLLPDEIDEPELNLLPPVEPNWDPPLRELDTNPLPLSEPVPKPLPDENLPLDPNPPLPDENPPLDEPEPNLEPRELDWKRPLELMPLPLEVEKPLPAILPDDSLDWELLPIPEPLLWKPLFPRNLLPLELENEPPCWKKPAPASFTATSGVC